MGAKKKFESGSKRKTISLTDIAIKNIKYQISRNVKTTYAVIGDMVIF